MYTRSANLFEHALGAQGIGERDGVDGLIVVGELHHRAENLAMGLAIEIVRGEDFERLVDGLVFEQDGAEHRLFGLDISARTSSRQVIGLGSHHILQLHNFRGGVFHFGGYSTSRIADSCAQAIMHTGRLILLVFPNLSTTTLRCSRVKYPFECNGFWQP